MRIIHILQGTVLHTTPGVINLMKTDEGKMIGDSPIEQFFCIAMYGKKMLYSNVDDNPYPELFTRLNHHGYRLFYSVKELIRFLLQLEKDDKILYHTLPHPKYFFSIEMALFFLKRRLYNRTSVILWGGDYQIPSINIKNKLYNSFLKIVLSSFKYVAAISSEDVKLTKAALPKANVIYCPYLDSRKMSLNSINREKRGMPLIMVSHSAWPQNDHHHTFELLKRFAGHVRVVCPLCYGKSEYLQDVIDEGKAIFGNDFSYFTELKKGEEYVEFLKNVDVFATSACHQTGMGTIFMCMANGSKIFVKGNLFTSLTEQNYKVFDIEKLNDISLDELSRPLDEIEAKFNVDNYNYLRFEGDEALEAWKTIFAY